jgi:hypothetical protein
MGRANRDCQDTLPVVPVDESQRTSDQLFSSLCAPVSHRGFRARRDDGTGENQKTIERFYPQVTRAQLQATLTRSTQKPCEQVMSGPREGPLQQAW